MARSWCAGSLLITIAAFTVYADAGRASAPTDLAHVHPAGTSRAPMGWVQFCADNPRECGPQRPAKPASLTLGKLQQLDAVNRHYNRTIAPVTDQEQYGMLEYWTYAASGKGDCEDYVLEKRRKLIQLGWEPANLAIIVVLDKSDGGHAVLTVVTNKGDYVLDNVNDQVLLWSQTGLTFLKRQSGEDPNVWVDLGRILGHPDAVTASLRSGAKSPHH